MYKMRFIKDTAIVQKKRQKLKLDYFLAFLCKKKNENLNKKLKTSIKYGPTILL